MRMIMKGLKHNMLKQIAKQQADYLGAADNLIMAGNNVVVAPGYYFAEAIKESSNS